MDICDCDFGGMIGAVSGYGLLVMGWDGLGYHSGGIEWRMSYVIYKLYDCNARSLAKCSCLTLPSSQASTQHPAPSSGKAYAPSHVHHTVSCQRTSRPLAPIRVSGTTADQPATLRRTFGLRLRLRLRGRAG